jgi:hypothetical protein
MRRLLLALVIPVAIPLAACASPKVDDWVSIDQGVYGKLVSGCDTSNCEDSAFSDEMIYVNTPGNATQIKTTKSNDDGYYEVALDPGAYSMCLYGTSCADVEIVAGKRVRFDFLAGPGGGMWTEVTDVPE